MQDAAKRQIASIKFTDRANLRFSPRRSDFLNRFTSKLARPTGTFVCMASQNVTSIGAWGGNAAPNYQNFPLFGKESPRRTNPLTDF